MEGAREEWKKAQKKEVKKKISEMINKIIPIRIPLYTYLEWEPENEASRAMSRHHAYKQKKMGGIVKRGEEGVEILCIQGVIIIKLLKILIEINKGQGLAVTKCQGW